MKSKAVALALDVNRGFIFLNALFIALELFYYWLEDAIELFIRRDFWVGVGF